MHEIEKWFNGDRNYQKGILLYSKYGKFSSVESMLRNLPDNKQSRELMEDHLNRILVANKAPTEQPSPAVEKSKGILLGIIKTSKAVVKECNKTELQETANKLYAEMGAAQARISAYGSNEERAVACKAFLELQKRWAEAQYTSDVFEETGALPEEPLYKPTERKKTKAAELTGSDYKKLTTLRSKVSRAEREQIPLYKTSPKFAAKLKKRLVEVEEWKKQIIQLEGGDNE